MKMLNKKERQIFYLFVRHHLLKNSPIGSKYLAKKINYKFSAPLLRFYFRRLAQKGLLLSKIQGRYPSDEGWKYYLAQYEIRPEIKIRNENLKVIIKNYLKLAKNSFIIIDKFRGIKIKGLHYLAQGLEKESLCDALMFIENVEKNIYKIEEKIGVKIGKEIDNSKTNNLSLGFIRGENKFYLFIGPKKNYYHTLWSILNKIKNKEKDK